MRDIVTGHIPLLSGERVENKEKWTDDKGNTSQNDVRRKVGFKGDIKSTEVSNLAKIKEMKKIRDMEKQTFGKQNISENKNKRSSETLLGDDVTSYADVIRSNKITSRKEN